jgi:tetratricopeptide (TPR) repeat protein
MIKKRIELSTLILCCFIAIAFSCLAAQTYPSHPSASIEGSGVEEISEWQARLELARLLSYQKRYSEAIAEYEKVLKIKPEMVIARIEMAKVLAWMGETDKALAYFQEVDANRLDEEARLALADIYVIRKEYSKAESIYGDFLAKHPEDHSVRLRLADLLTWAKKYDLAIGHFEKILEARPDDVQVRRRYGRVLGWAGRQEEAIVNLRKSLGK